MVDELLDTVRELPPSAKLVFRVLEAEGDMTQQQVIEATGLPGRTVRYAVSELEESGAITKRPSLFDARQRVYSLTCD